MWRYSRIFFFKFCAELPTSHLTHALISRAEHPIGKAITETFQNLLGTFLKCLSRAFYSTSLWHQELEPAALTSGDRGEIKITVQPAWMHWCWSVCLPLLEANVGYSDFSSNYWTEPAANSSVTWESRGEFHVADTSQGSWAGVYKCSPQGGKAPGKSCQEQCQCPGTAEPGTGNAQGIAGLHVLQGDLFGAIKGREKRDEGQETISKSCYLTTFLFGAEIAPGCAREARVSLVWNGVFWEEQHKSRHTKCVCVLSKKKFLLCGQQSRSRNHQFSCAGEESGWWQGHRAGSAPSAVWQPQPYSPWKDPYLFLSEANAVKIWGCRRRDGCRLV